MKELKENVLIIRNALDEIGETGFTTNGMSKEELEREGFDSEYGLDLNEYLNDLLDIEYTFGADGSFLGSRLLLTYGGPTIYVNTRYSTVEGYWGGDSFELSYACSELDEYVENRASYLINKQTTCKK